MKMEDITKKAIEEAGLPKSTDDFKKYQFGVPDVNAKDDTLEIAFSFDEEKIAEELRKDWAYLKDEWPDVSGFSIMKKLKDDTEGKDAKDIDWKSMFETAMTRMERLKV